MASTSEIPNDPPAQPRAELLGAVAQYHAGCLRVIGAQNVAMRDVRTAKKAALACDVAWLTDVDLLLSGELRLSSPANRREEMGLDDAGHAQAMIVWERIRELAAKAALDSYAKEVVYAGPLLHGILPRSAGGHRLEPVLAPLFTQAVQVVVQDDGAVQIRPKDEPIRFNPAVWSDALPADDIRQVVGFGIGAQADMAGGYDPERIAELLEGIASVLPSLELSLPGGSLGTWPEREAATEMRYASARLRLVDAGALFLSNRASPYLLHDLETIGTDPTSYLSDGSPLSLLVSRPGGERPAASAPSIEEIVFPFPSNDAQRQVEDALEKNELVVVQGPPGTGKSLTIANLVCHLVATGRSVLVTSHKTQALTVVREKLAETDLRFLYASMIGDGAAGKKELQTQIAGAKDFAGRADATRLAQQLEKIERRRIENGELYRQMLDDFTDRADPEQVEAARIYPPIERVNLLPLADSIVLEADRPAIADALIRFDELVRAHADAWPMLRESRLASALDTGDNAIALAEFIRSGRSRIRAARDPNVAALVAAWHEAFDRDPAAISSAREAIESIAQSLVDPLRAALREDDADLIRGVAATLSARPDVLADTRDAAAALRVAAAAARELAPGRRDVALAPDRRHELLIQHAALDSLLRKRAARRWLDEHAPGAIGLPRDRVERWVAFWESWEAFRVRAEALPGGLRTIIPSEYEPDLAADLCARVEHTVVLAEGISQTHAIAKKAPVPLPTDAAVSASSEVDLVDVIDAWRAAVDAADADAHGNELKASAPLAFARDQVDHADALLDAHSYEEADAAFERLELVLATLPALARANGFAQILTGVPAALSEIERAAASRHPPPEFLSDLDTALKMQPAQHRFAQIGDGPTTRDRAELLGALRKAVGEDARRVLDYRIQRRILDGFRRPAFLSSLEAFRKAVAASPKRHERIEELKDSPDFDVRVLTDVFPCWIMRPEDACRVFPLEPGMFDVVIFDEASQCNPDQALPLFARAKRIAIFGDDKQLSNEDLRRSLSGDANRTLLRQARLNELDPSHLFDQTQHSLLEVTARRQQATVLLNEHFRCRPEIIAFSNNAFYGETLRVIRDRGDDRGLGPALLIRELENAPPADGSKVNYAEARAVISELKRLLADPRYANSSFGVLSLFRDQIEHLQILIEREVPVAIRERHHLICSTADGFQGDERDVILYSWRYTPDLSPSVFAFTNGPAGQARMNVALTRARHQAIHFVSVAPSRLPQGAGAVKRFLEHAERPERLLAEAERRVHREPPSEARTRVRNALEAAGYSVYEDVVACGAGIDLVCEDTTRRARIAVFVDAAEDPHRPPDSPLRVDVHGLLERAGWTVLRMPATTALPTPAEIVGLVESVVADLPLVAGAPDSEPAYATLTADGSDAPAHSHLNDELSTEDLADYNWAAGNVEARSALGSLFDSDFERDLFDRLSAYDHLVAVPQWPSRGKLIDLVVTDREGRRLAVEADGAQHHQTNDGALIPEDLERQVLLEEAGWAFHRVAHDAYLADPERQVRDVLAALAARPSNFDLAAEVFGAPPAASTIDVVEIDRSFSVHQSDSGVPLRVFHLGAARSGQSDLAALPGSEAEFVNEGVTPQTRKPEAHRAPEVPSAGSTPFDAVPLGSIAMQIGELVRGLREVREDDLVPLYSAHFHVNVPQQRVYLLRRFAWSAKGHLFIDRTANGLWIPGSREPARVEALGDWTLSSIIVRARELLSIAPDDDHSTFEQLVQEVCQRERAPKLIASVIGKAIHAARNPGEA